MTAYVTESQRRIARALRELTDEAGYPPSIREIAETGGIPSVSIRANAVCGLRGWDVLRRAVSAGRPYRPRTPPLVSAFHWSRVGPSCVGEKSGWAASQSVTARSTSSVL